MENPKAKIIGIARHRLSTDGNGVTTLVAFHGCALRCKYCLNPQSITETCSFPEYSPEELYDTITRTSPDSAQNNGAPDLSLGKPDLNIVVGGVDEGRDNMDTCSHDSAVRQDSSSAYDKDNVIFGAIESDPQFPGGQRALLDWVQTNLIYPPIGPRSRQTGKSHRTVRGQIRRNSRRNESRKKQK